MSAITFERRLHAELHFYVLAHLDLGRDAASIHDPRLSARRPAWLSGLRAAYLESPKRLRAQALPLRAPDLPCMLNDLEEGRAALDPALNAALLEALRAEMPAFARRWRAGRAEAEAQRAALEAEIIEPLRLLRAALWALEDEEAPPLRVFDARWLGWAGRASAFSRERRVAASLGKPAAHALCQIFHEEVHAISDRGVPLEGRSTAVGAEGFEAHRVVELRAIELGRRLIEVVTPQRSGDYEAWARRVGGA